MNIVYQWQNEGMKKKNYRKKCALYFTVIYSSFDCVKTQNQHRFWYEKDQVYLKNNNQQRHQ